LSTQTLAKEDSSVFVFECELVDAKQVEQGVQEANTFHGRATDHIVYAASRRIKPGYFWEQDVALMKEAMDVNYLGAVVVVKVWQTVRSFPLRDKLGLTV
jgi:NAD(P)-dependent dehydrogenase (short-subunit alcohol dehydrogenase family)